MKKIYFILFTIILLAACQDRNSQVTKYTIEQFYKDHMNNYAFPILYKNYHLFKGEFINRKSYQSLEFNNMYLATLALIQQNNKIYKRALAKNQELKDELANVLDINE